MSFWQMFADVICRCEALFFIRLPLKNPKRAQQQLLVKVMAVTRNAKLLVKLAIKKSSLQTFNATFCSNFRERIYCSLTICFLYEIYM